MKRNYDDEAYRQWRLDILKRDKHCCKMPGCKSKRRLNVHHIRKWASYSALRYDIHNGITLCYSCHKLITGKEEAYADLFTYIVSLYDRKKK